MSNKSVELSVIRQSMILSKFCMKLLFYLRRHREEILLIRPHHISLLNIPKRRRTNRKSGFRGLNRALRYTYFTACTSWYVFLTSSRSPINCRNDLGVCKIKKTKLNVCVVFFCPQRFDIDLEQVLCTKSTMWSNLKNFLPRFWSHK